MSVTQYIGARYVPLFADPLAWDITQQYEPLTIVYYQGNSYTSRQAVPTGIDITNTEYWALTGNYNAQIEQYRTEVQTYDGRITANTTSNTAQDAQLAGTSSSGLKTLIDANASDIDDLESADTAFAAQMAGTTSSGLKTLIQTNASDIDALEGQMAGTSPSGLLTLIQAASRSFSSANEYEGAVSVAFGDSNMWGQAYTAQNIYRRVCNLLGCEYHNYALSGAGFERVNNVNSVVQQINAEDDVVPSEVKLVLIMAGINDYHYGSHSSSTFQSAVSDALNAAIIKYTNAKICVMFDSGSQLPDANLLLFELGLARQAQRKERCIHVPLADICTQSNCWENLNHYNDTGAEVVAGRIKNALMGGSLALATPAKTSNSYTQTNASDSGYYGFETVVETIIDPVDFTRTDTMFISFFGPGLKNVDTTKTATASGEVLCKVPVFLPHADYSSNRGLCSIPVQTVSSGTVSDSVLMFMLYQVEPSGYSDSPEVEFRFRFNSNFSNYSGMVGGAQLTFFTSARDV